MYGVPLCFHWDVYDHMNFPFWDNKVYIDIDFWPKFLGGKNYIYIFTFTGTGQNSTHTGRLRVWTQVCFLSGDVKLKS